MGLSKPEMNEARGVISEPQILTLKDGSRVRWSHLSCTPPISKYLPQSLVTFLFEEFNTEIERGDTYPYLHTLSRQEFEDYWFSAFCAVLIKGEGFTLSEDYDWATQVLGTYYIKPNYLGRASHVCNAGFLVNPRLRGLGMGNAIGASYLKWAPILGYDYSVFNLVFVTNVASVKIWDNLGFDRIGRIPGVGKLKGYEEPVDAIMFGKKLI